MSITHQFGPWSPMRFLPVPSRPNGEPAFWVTTARVCRGIHDWRCAETQSQTFGPLVLEGKSTDDLEACANCGRVQPPVHPAAAAVGEQHICLFCSDGSVVQHTADERVTTDGVSAVAALYAGGAMLRQAREADPNGYLALLDETGDLVRALFDDAAWAVKQDPQRGQQTMYRGLAMVARQVLANASFYATMHPEPKEPLPVTEVDGE
jgi:hypothetical protein